MFCVRKSKKKKKIDKVHGRTSRLIYQDNSNFEISLEKQLEFLIHQTNLQVLMTAIYKMLNDVSPPITKSLF